MNSHSSKHTENILLQQLPEIERKVKETGGTIITPLVSLETPGKATVEVVILADPVSHHNHNN